MTTIGASFLAARTRSAPQGFGRPVPRKEDARLVTGRGRFSDDFNLPGQAHAHLVRSPHAHARILAIDATDALAAPGVLAVLTGRDAAADGLASIPHKPVPTNPNEFPLGGREGGRVLVTPHPPLAADVARFAGEAVAMVVAETAAAAAGAAERVRVAWEPLPAVTATPDAGEPGAPVLWSALGSNLCVNSIAGLHPGQSRPGPGGWLHRGSGGHFVSKSGEPTSTRCIADGHVLFLRARSVRAPRSLDGLPDAFGRRRHLDVLDAQFGQRVADRVHHRAERGRGAALAAAAEPERVRGRLDLADLGGE